MILNIKQETAKKDENHLSIKRLKIQVNFPYLLLQLHFQDYVIWMQATKASEKCIVGGEFCYFLTETRDVP